MAFNGLSVFVLLCGCLTLAIAVYAWRRRSTPGAGVFAAFMGLMSVYILAYSMELASLSIQSMLFWNKIEYIGILLFPILYPVFIYHYTGQQQRIQRWMVVLLLLVPFALLLVKFFDDRLHLIYSSAGVYLGAP
ncbi:MAG: hypothetical protein HY835_04070, partial [Anaerolineae bacterium]|nr:hypothetical protein [Anaerolineae bacterium]